VPKCNITEFLSFCHLEALRETPEFADAKRRLQKRVDQTYINSKVLENDPILNEKANKKNDFIFISSKLCVACMFLFRLCTLR
jgi:hypothetical protein